MLKVADAEAPVLWPPDLNSRLIGKDPDVGKDWRQKEKRVTEGEIVGWHHWLNGHELGNFGSLGGTPIGEGLFIWEMVRDREAWCVAVHGVSRSRIQLGEWATATKRPSVLYFTQWYSECITHLFLEVVVNSCRLEIQYLLIIDAFPTVRMLF